ncbi:transposase [Pseudoxanthomonas dokdonensis]|uniref:Transposase n=1 Tax=Pseudoxanthomonas dokdonensis TaxID=344882 RepID=A0A0R0CN51_9GAMM|nr:transposase [Pseudoxanthomonas dokdonensis]
MAQRRKFSEEFKREAVGLIRLPCANVSQIAQDLGVGANLLWRWRRELDKHCKKSFVGAGVARDEEILALKRQSARVTKARDFLRDAAAFFAKESS